MFDSYSVLKVVPLSTSNTTQLNEYDKENEPNIGYDVVGGILKDSRHVWTHSGPRFNVINCKTGEKVASWCFGYVIKDPSARIVCVDEILRASGKLSLLVIGIQSEITSGTICIFDIYGSRVLRAISINKQVTSVHVVDPGRGTPGPFENFDGVLAVGTIGGDVLLIDLNRHACENALNCPKQCMKDEVDACQLLHLPVDAIPNIEVLEQRHLASKNGEHICTHLNAYDDVTPHFILKGPKGDDRIHVNKVEVTVSSLYYSLQLGVLFVGYNFGAWQMWDLINLKLIYTSPIFDDNIPVAHFALQEPSDDPRAFCYIWVIYTCADAQSLSLPMAVLYSLNYGMKKVIDGYGVLYQNLSSCAVRFQSELALLDEDIQSNGRNGAFCLGLQSINTTISIGGSLHENQKETISLCSITWNGWSSSSNQLKTYMCLFDLNQWYKAQMPSTARAGECDTYMSNICISKILDDVNLNSILNVQININSLKHFVGSQRLEEHYFPSSLAFQMFTLTEYNIISINNHGSQRALLSHLETGGALTLVKPTNFFQRVIELGLLPLFTDLPLNGSATFEQQREILLSIALEQKLLGWLCRCALQYNNGSYSATGCTLNFLLNWGWERAAVLKKNADSFCISLFDYSGLQLDANTHNMLSNCARQLRNLYTLFDYVVQKCCNCELETVKQQKESLQMAAIHLEVLLWLLNIGLLPECPLSSYPRIDEFDRISAPYDVDQITKYYNERRAFLHSCSKEPVSISDSFLFIDNFINYECRGTELQKQWQGDSGNILYPPPSLQALIRTYLVENVDVATKHLVILYLFLDIISNLDHIEYKHVITNLLKFPAIFHVPPSMIKVTQGFWKLDHGDFTSALDLLLDPIVSSGDFKLWQHQVVLKALLMQEQFHLALSYLQVRRPPLTDVNDICTVLSLFISNSMIDDAFNFQRLYKYNSTYKKILQHFFQECDQHGAIAFIQRLPLTVEEKESFHSYLHMVKHPRLENFQSHTSVQHVHLLPQESVNVWKEVEKPTPLSVMVHSSQQQIKYKSTSIHVKLASIKDDVRQTPRLICPRILEDLSHDGASPCKRFKPSPRLSVTSPDRQCEKRNSSIYLHTPIVKRKIPKQSLLLQTAHGYQTPMTPQSILKVRSITHSPDTSSFKERCVTPENLTDITTTTPLFDKFKAKQASFNITSRKSVQHSPKPVVHFNISKSLSDASLALNQSEPQVLNERSSVSSKVSESSEDSYHSPLVSVTNNDFELDQIYEISSSNYGLDRITEEDNDNHQSTRDSVTPERSPSWPKPRRSYRALMSDFPSRSSPRLRKMMENKTMNDKLLTPKNVVKEILLDKEDSVSKKKLKDKKSLSKSMLECNTNITEDKHSFLEDKSIQNNSRVLLSNSSMTIKSSPMLVESTETAGTYSPSKTTLDHTEFLLSTPKRISPRISARSSISEPSTISKTRLFTSLDKCSPPKLKKSVSPEIIPSSNVTFSHSQYSPTLQSSDQQNSLIPSRESLQDLENLRVCTSSPSSIKDKSVIVSEEDTSNKRSLKRGYSPPRARCSSRLSRETTSKESDFSKNETLMKFSSKSNTSPCKVRRSSRLSPSRSVLKESKIDYTIIPETQLPSANDLLSQIKQSVNSSSMSQNENADLHFDPNVTIATTAELSKDYDTHTHSPEKQIELCTVTKTESNLSLLAVTETKSFSLSSQLLFTDKSSEENSTHITEKSHLTNLKGSEETTLSFKCEDIQKKIDQNISYVPCSNEESKTVTIERNQIINKPIVADQISVCKKVRTSSDTTPIKGIKENLVQDVKEPPTEVSIQQIEANTDRIYKDLLTFKDQYIFSHQSITKDELNKDKSQDTAVPSHEVDNFDIVASGGTLLNEAIIHKSIESVCEPTLTVEVQNLEQNVVPTDCTSLVNKLNENVDESIMIIEGEVPVNEPMSLVDVPVSDLNTVHMDTIFEQRTHDNLDENVILIDPILGSNTVQSILTDTEDSNTDLNKSILIEDSNDMSFEQTVDNFSCSQRSGALKENLSSFTTLVPVDLEMNIFEVPDDIGIMNTGLHLEHEDSIADTHDVPEIQDNSIASSVTINELDQTIMGHTINTSKISQITTIKDDADIIEIESSDASDVASITEESDEESQSLSDDPALVLVLEPILEEPLSEDLDLVKTESNETVSKITEHFHTYTDEGIIRVEEESVTGKSKHDTIIEIKGGTAADDINDKQVLQPESVLNATEKDIMDYSFDEHVEASELYEKDILDRSIEETVVEGNISCDIMDKTVYNETVLQEDDIFDKTTAPIETPKNKKLLEESGLLHNSKTDLQNLGRLTRKRTRSFTVNTSTPKNIDFLESTFNTPLANERDIFEDTLLMTPYTSNRSTDILEKSEYMNQTSTNANNSTDIFDKTDKINTPDSEETIFKENVAKAKTPLRRSRRLSSSGLSGRDNVSTPLPSKTLHTSISGTPAKIRRSKSVDITPKAIKERTPEPTLIASESATKTKKTSTVKKSKSEIVDSKAETDYTKSRRLTRKQASVIEKSFSSLKAKHPNSTLSFDLDTSDGHNRGPDIEIMDPLNLMDKKDFEGKPDSVEENFLKRSPASSISGSVSSFGTRKRRGRSVSISSKVSEDSDASSEKKLLKKNPINKEGISTRLTRRTKSADEPTSTSSLRKIRKTRDKAKVTNDGEAGDTENTTGVAQRTRSKSLVDQPVSFRKSSRQQVIKPELFKIVEVEEPIKEDEKKRLVK